MRLDVSDEHNNLYLLMFMITDYFIYLFWDDYWREGGFMSLVSWMACDFYLFILSGRLIFYLKKLETFC